LLVVKGLSYAQAIAHRQMPLGEAIFVP